MSRRATQHAEDPSVFVPFPLPASSAWPLGQDTTSPGRRHPGPCPPTPPSRRSGWTLTYAPRSAARPDRGRGPGRAGAGRGRQVAARFSGADLGGRRYQGPVFALGTAIPGAGHGYPQVIAADSSRSTTAPASSTSLPAFGADDYRVAAEQGIFTRPGGSPLQPGPTRRQLRRPRGGSADRFVKTRGDREIIADLSAAACSSARRSTSTPTRSAGAAARRCSTTHPSWSSAPPRCGAGPRQQRGDRLAPRAHQARPLRQMAGEQRRLGALARTLLGHAAAGLALRRGSCGELECVGSVAELRERSGGAVPDDLHRPYIDEVTLPCEQVRRQMRRVER